MERGGAMRMGRGRGGWGRQHNKGGLEEGERRSVVREEGVQE